MRHLVTLAGPLLCGVALPGGWHGAPLLKAQIRPIRFSSTLLRATEPVEPADPAEPAESAAPSAAALVRFAMPMLGGWLVSPLMSLIDTGVVGRSATPVELAALGPATMVCDSSAYLLSFLGVATTCAIHPIAAPPFQPHPDDPIPFPQQHGRHRARARRQRTG